MTADSSGNGLDATLRDFTAGQKIFRRYTLVKTLGRGGMGVVWLAHDDVLDRDVALKFLPELLVHDRAVLSDLKRETNRSLELTHKNIVRIYDFVHDDTSGCISMEYIDGDTLSNLRADRPTKVFEAQELTTWTSQLCDALDYAHNHARVVHRDLKPSNLMVNQRGDLKVADFGIARSLGDSMSMLTVNRGTSGTLLYMSPQQLDGERGTHLDDIYSLGATLYELLTSKPPFYSGNVDRQIREKIAPPMSQRRQELEIEATPIDDTWEKTVAACLQKEPARRPQSVMEIVNLLTTPTPQRIRWFPLPSTRKTRERTRTSQRPPEVARTKRVSEKRFRGAGLALVAAGKAIAQGAAKILLAASTELGRGVVITVVPAAVVAGLIWYMAHRPPPKPQAARPVTVAPAVQAPVASKQSESAAAVQPAPASPPEPSSAATGEGTLWINTSPAGATVIVDTSIQRASPASFSHLAAGKHALLISKAGYNTEQREVEVKPGEVTSPDLITLQAASAPPPPVAAKAKTEEPAQKQPTQKENEQKVAAAKKAAHNRQPPEAQAEKSTSPAARQAAATPTPLPKIITKPTPTPQQKRDRAFEGGVPGG